MALTWDEIAVILSTLPSPEELARLVEMGTEEANFDYAKLDPGIREIVRLLRYAGFDTADSGDGVSKSRSDYERGYALRTPHIFSVAVPDQMLKEARRMQTLLGGAWAVEASFSATDGTALLMAWLREED